MQHFPGGQFLHISVEFEEYILPVLLILMTGRKEGLYKNIFQKLTDIAENLSSSTSMADYEMAISNALKSVFQGVRLTGCRFYFGQAIHQKSKQLANRIYK